MSLRQKVFIGVLWSSLSQFSVMGMEFIFGLILARLLTPAEFGLIGMITIFILIAQIFINSGFKQALVRKTECTDEDYSTVFVFNLVVGVLFFLIIYFIAPLVSMFYEKPVLTSLLRVLSLSLIISSFTIIQRATLVRRLDFKLQARIGITATVVSGVLAIACAYLGMGVWSLVVKTLSRELIYSILIWTWNAWKPSLGFVKSSFDELFGFGSKLLVSGIVGSIFNNINYVIIGKYFSADILGYYTRAEMFKKLPSQNISSIVTSVVFPALAKVQDDPIKLKYGFKKVLTTTAMVVFVLMAGMIAVAEPMIISLIGEIWRPSIYMLQVLCVAGMLLPISSININMLNVVGRSDIYMKLLFITQFLTIPAAIIGVYYGMEALIYAVVVNSFIGYLVFGYTAGKFINYPITEQMKDMAPLLCIAILTALSVYGLGMILDMRELFELIIQVTFGGLVFIGLCKILRIEAFREISKKIFS